MPRMDIGWWISRTTRILSHQRLSHHMRPWKPALIKGLFAWHKNDGTAGNCRVTLHTEAHTTEAVPNQRNSLFQTYSHYGTKLSVLVGFLISEFMSALIPMASR